METGKFYSECGTSHKRQNNFISKAANMVLISSVVVLFYIAIGANAKSFLFPLCLLKVFVFWAT